MNDVQVALTADLIIDKILLSQIGGNQIVFRNAMASVRFTIGWTVISFSAG